MRKLLMLPLLFISMTAATCGDIPDNNKKQETDKGDRPDDDQNDNPDGESRGRYLVLYSSWSGKTEQVAQAIGTALDCDIVEVEPHIPYENDYDAMLRRSQEEQGAIERGNYPPVITEVDNLEDYDTVFVGYPIWYGHMATPMQAFLHENAERLSGKRIALFATSGSSGIATSVNDSRKICPAATFTETLLITSGGMGQIVTRVADWLEQIGADLDEGDLGDEPDNSAQKIEITIGDKIVTATMEDNAAAHDFISHLPLTVALQDYAGTEKIFYPDPKLTLDGISRGLDPSPGDITLYVPWGNVAIFYKDAGYSSDLIRLGHLDGDGIKALSVPGSVSVRFQKVEINS